MSLAGTLYIERNSPLHRLNPFTKLCAGMVGAVAVFTLPSTYAPWILALVFLGPVAAVAGVAHPLFRAMAILYLPFCCFLFVVHGLFHPSDGEELARFWIFSVQAAPLLYALRIAGRVAALFSMGCLLVMTTHPGKLMKDLQNRGLHWSISYIVCATLQMLPLLRGRARSIQLAQQARGLDTSGSLAKRIKALLPLAAPLAYGAMLDVEDRALALESRGVMRPGRREFLEPVADSTGQRAFRIACLLLALALAGYRLWLFSL